MSGSHSFVRCEPSAEHPGWFEWHVGSESRYNQAVLGRQIVRRDEDGRCRHRMMPHVQLTNAADIIHGGAILGLSDVSMFSALYLLSDVDAGQAVTLDLQAQFMAPGDPAEPVDAVVELLKETRRIAFLRGTVVQGEAVIAAYTGTVRKPSSRS